MDEKYYTARILRKNSTIHEKRLWNLLKNRQFHNLRFKRQVPIGNYVVDFLCPKIRLIIELDGGQHNEPANMEYDIERTKFLKNKGYKVIRFWNNDIYKNINGVLEEIEKHINKDIQPHPQM